jgi:hypothetical protein
VTDEPVGGYDGLKTRELIASLSRFSQAELAVIESYERSHKNRKAVFGKLRGLRRVGERLRKQKALSSDEVVAALRRFRARKVAPVSRNAKR